MLLWTLLQKFAVPILFLKINLMKSYWLLFEISTYLYIINFLLKYVWNVDTAKE